MLFRKSATHPKGIIFCNDPLQIAGRQFQNTFKLNKYPTLKPETET